MTKHSSPDDETPTAETLREALDGSIDTKLRLIPCRAKMARLLAEEILDEEVASLAGGRYSRKGDGNPFRRWGSNSGSIRIDGEKVPTGGATRPRHRRGGGAAPGKLSGDEKRGGRPGDGESDFARALARRLSGGRWPVCRRIRPEPVLSEPPVSGKGPESPGRVREPIAGRGKLPGPLNLWETRYRRADDRLHGGDGGWLQEGAGFHASHLRAF